MIITSAAKVVNAFYGTMKKSMKKEQKKYSILIFYTDLQPCDCTDYFIRKAAVNMIL